MNKEKALEPLKILIRFKESGILYLIPLYSDEIPDVSGLVEGTDYP